MKAQRQQGRALSADDFRSRRHAATDKATGSGAKRHNLSVLDRDDFCDVSFVADHYVAITARGTRHEVSR